jgi:hypothetical protein
MQRWLRYRQFCGTVLPASTNACGVKCSSLIACPYLPKPQAVPQVLKPCCSFCYLILLYCCTAVLLQVCLNVMSGGACVPRTPPYGYVAADLPCLLEPGLQQPLLSAVMAVTTMVTSDPLMLSWAVAPGEPHVQDCQDLRHTQTLVPVCKMSPSLGVLMN